MVRLLFIHGAGGQVEDRRLADELGAALGLAVDMPLLPETDMSYEAWASPVSEALEVLTDGDVAVGHSFGASILLRALAERQDPLRSVMLLAMPDWSAAGWDVAEYDYDEPWSGGALLLHHCRDDEVVPFEHLGHHAARLHVARVHEHPSGGHQFHGLARHLIG